MWSKKAIRFGKAYGPTPTSIPKENKSIGTERHGNFFVLYQDLAIKGNLVLNRAGCLCKASLVLEASKERKESKEIKESQGNKELRVTKETKVIKAFKGFKA